uniref:Uncharacterized protein n=1 Tax=Avena sativa TaxID=4498 RepID=A0ACD6A0Z4_AVESA
MADSRRSPHADDPSCGGGGANYSMTPQESEDTEGYSPAAPPPSVHNSGQPVRSIFVNELPSDGPTIGAASSSAWVSDEGEDAKITDKTAGPFLLGPRSSSSPMGASDSDSDGDGESWIGFGDRAGGEASTSTSSPDAYDYRTVFGDPHSYVEMRDQWCRQHVIPMPEEVEEFHVVALIDVLHVPVRIVNVDISDTVEPYTHNIYESPDALPCVTLLYRPGHYDILY